MSDEEFVLVDVAKTRTIGTSPGGRPTPVSPRPARAADAIGNLQRELDGYYKDLTKLNGLDPISAFQRLSAYSARASEIRSQLFRIESRKSQSFRTQQVDPFLEEVDRQFKIHSRLQAIREMEFKMVGPL